MLRVAATLLAAVFCCACVTRPPVTDVYPDDLDQIRPGSRVTVMTRDGRSVTMTVTRAGTDELAGVDGDYRAFEFRPHELERVTVASQNDTVVMLAWLAVLVAMGL